MPSVEEFQAMEDGTVVDGSNLNETDVKNNAHNADIVYNSDEIEEKLLTKEEQDRVENGENVNIYLKVEEATNSVDINDKKLIEQVAVGKTLNVYLDISLYKQVGNDEPQKVTNTSGGVKITLKLDDKYINNDKNIQRTYNIIRVHNGVVDILDCEFDEATSSLIFETDRFSTYALVYTDKVLDDSNNTKDDKDNNTTDDVNKDNNNTTDDINKDNNNNITDDINKDNNNNNTTDDINKDNNNNTKDDINTDNTNNTNNAQNNQPNSNKETTTPPSHSDDSNVAQADVNVAQPDNEVTTGDKAHTGVWVFSLLFAGVVIVLSVVINKWRKTP